jgi:hypothetical protein
MTYSGMMLIPSFMEIHVLLQMLLGGGGEEGGLKGMMVPQTRM